MMQRLALLRRLDQWLHRLRTRPWAAVSAIAISVCAVPALAADGEPLSTMLGLMRAELGNSKLERPMLLKTSDTANGLKGDVYALVDQPLTVLSLALGTPAQWCEAMLLHINNRRCTVTTDASGETITLNVVRRYDQPVESAFVLPFAFSLIDKTTRHLEVRLGASSGPLGTSNYRIVVEAVPADASHSFLHFSYAYDENFLAHTAMQAYLATFGRSKVGFTVIGQKSDGAPEYIRGMQGLMERNAMRYFLALDAHVHAGKDAESARNAWFSATERYPRQLHEIDRAPYLELKAIDAKH